MDNHSGNVVLDAVRRQMGGELKLAPAGGK